MSRKSDIISFVGGIAVGAAVGLLLAPEKGEKTRKKLRKKFEDLKDNAVEIGESKVTDFFSKAQSYIDELKHQVSNMEDKIKSHKSYKEDEEIFENQ